MLCITGEQEYEEEIEKGMALIIIITKSPFVISYWVKFNLISHTKGHSLDFHTHSPPVAIENMAILRVAAIGAERGLEDDNLWVESGTGQADGNVLAAPFLDEFCERWNGEGVFQFQLSTLLCTKNKIMSSSSFLVWTAAYSIHYKIYFFRLMVCDKQHTYWRF